MIGTREGKESRLRQPFAAHFEAAARYWEILPYLVQENPLRRIWDEAQTGTRRDDVQVAEKGNGRLTPRGLAVSGTPARYQIHELDKTSSW